MLMHQKRTATEPAARLDKLPGPERLIPSRVTIRLSRRQWHACNLLLPVKLG